MLTDRGRWVLAFGAFTYLAAWGFGSAPLYPIALGLVLAVGGAALWMRLLRRPMRLSRTIAGGEHVAGDDVPVRLELEVAGSLPVRSVLVVDRVAALGERGALLRRRHGRMSGGYVLRAVPRGRYPIEGAQIVVEDPFGLERLEVGLPGSQSLLVYPKLVELERLFSDSGARALEGRRLLLRRPSGFELHSVREYEPGESLRRVHWPSTAKRAQLMVKELEDSPRDEAVVVLDAAAGAVAGTPPDSTFELAVRAAGSILKARVGRGRRASLVVNDAARSHRRVHSLDGDWRLALELLACVEPNGTTSAAALLADEAGPAARALELTVVTSMLSPRLVDRLLQRTYSRHAATLVYIDAASFASAAPTRPHREAAAQLSRLQRAGIPVAVLRRGDDLVAKLGDSTPARAVG